MAKTQIRQADYTDYSNSFNELDFVIRQRISNINTAIVVKVVKVKTDTKSVDVLPMVQQISADGSVIDHGTVYNIPYFMLQGGVNAILITPAVDDIGLLVCCSRDISSVKNAKQVAPPSSRRMHTFSDGLYIGGFLNQDATRFIKFGDNGVEIDPQSLLKVIGDLTVTGTIQCDTLKANNIILGGVDLNQIIENINNEIQQQKQELEALKAMIDDRFITQSFTDANNPNEP